MVTDDERREVARRLREYVDLPDDWWQETRAEFYVEKCVFGNVDRHSEAELFTRLADLIEPSDSAQTVAEDMFGQMRHSTEQERVAYADMMARNSVELHPVDRDALLALAVNLDARATELLKVNDLDQSRQRRSARLAHATDLMAACSRIREALGEGES